ncbi:sensor histidine kinase [Massilibacteroides vaginae]|uniref:sensor histidine kinase n=1 Tax=Massilibacteroides vaginae TaxID=1673718 RepID=UPI000A1CE631|nr:histidine kinase [Massilibacteroides vaginae]
MKIIENYSRLKLLLIALVGAVIITYPNIICIPWELTVLHESQYFSMWMFLGIRYIFYSVLLWLLLYQNLTKMKTVELKTRFIRTFLIVVPAYLIYLCISKWYGPKFDFFSTITCQFLVMAAISILSGHLSMLYIRQRKNEQVIEQLKIDNLQSRCDALANQINPHFFFNSLNGIAALIRKKNDENTLAYVDKLSDVFRYILRSDKRGLVSLEEELNFIHAFRYMLEVRFANKLLFDIVIDQRKMNLKIPVLSLLPLIDNIIMHNRIDSDHNMMIKIYMNSHDELIVSNPIYPKLTLPDTNGTGLKNLSNRFQLMLNKQIRIEDNEETFSVYLPLN